MSSGSDSLNAPAASVQTAPGISRERLTLLMRAARRQGMLRAVGNPYGEVASLNETAQAIFGALAATLGLAAVATFYDEFLPGTQTPSHSNEAAQKGDALTPASSIAHDFAVLSKSVPTAPASSILQDFAVLPKSIHTGPVVRGSTLQPALGVPPQQSIAMELEPRPATARVEFSSVATTLSSRAEPVNVCARYGGHRVHFMRGHHAMWKCVDRKRRQ
jgi:hypothetical protein